MGVIKKHPPKNARSMSPPIVEVHRPAWIEYLLVNRGSTFRNHPKKSPDNPSDLSGPPHPLTNRQTKITLCFAFLWKKICAKDFLRANHHDVKILTVFTIP
jgi:hypothetical protein